MVTNSYLKQFQTTVKPDETSSTVITAGPFSVSRHPMYLGMSLILFGEVLYLGSVISFLMPVIFIMLMELFYIPLEEKTLQTYFREEFSHYKTQVRRWL